MDVKKGKYRHFKGNLYEVVAVAKHSETCEEYVVYKALYGKQEFWIRSKEMFMERIESNGVQMPRFEYLGE